MTPDDVRALARDVPPRWSSMDLVHRSPGPPPEIRAHLEHGYLDAVEADGHRWCERGAPPSSFEQRDLEPFPTNYRWSAMLDPYELTVGVTLSEVRRGELFGRPTVEFVARAEPGYDPFCSCCPLVLSEISQRLEYGEDWQPGAFELPDGVDLALDLQIGIVVSSRDRGGRRQDWFTNEILAST